MSLLAVFGTRPEYLKLKPLFDVLKMNKCFVGQHTNIINFEKFDYKINLSKKKSNRLNLIFSEVIKKLENIIDKYDAVIVVGDTATVAATSIATFNQKKILIHLEAGLRTYDLKNPYPEESYRQIVSRISSIHLCPTTLSKENLIKEKVSGKIYVVGNTSLDNILNIKNDTKYLDEVLITLHRNENLPMMKEWFEEIEKLANKFKYIKFILPLHPNPLLKKHSNILKKVKVIKPLNHDDLLNKLKHSKLIITDSGGIQEEGSFLNKKIIVCRKVTERPEGIYSGHLKMCPSPKKLNKIFLETINNYKIDSDCPYGDGLSSKRIAKILKKYER